jgi:hypothetical protein
MAASMQWKRSFERLELAGQRPMAEIWPRIRGQPSRCDPKQPVLSSFELPVIGPHHDTND